MFVLTGNPSTKPAEVEIMTSSIEVHETLLLQEGVFVFFSIPTLTLVLFYLFFCMGVNLSLILGEEHRLRVFEKRVLRRM
jgi:hypothetical protein